MKAFISWLFGMALMLTLHVLTKSEIASFEWWMILLAFAFFMGAMYGFFDLFERYFGMLVTLILKEMRSKQNQ